MAGRLRWFLFNCLNVAQILLNVHGSSFDGLACQTKTTALRYSSKMNLLRNQTTWNLFFSIFDLTALLKWSCFGLVVTHFSQCLWTEPPLEHLVLSLLLPISSACSWSIFSLQLQAAFNIKCLRMGPNPDMLINESGKKKSIFNANSRKDIKSALSSSW